MNTVGVSLNSSFPVNQWSSALQGAGIQIGKRAYVVQIEQSEKKISDERLAALRDAQWKMIANYSQQIFEDFKTRPECRAVNWKKVDLSVQGLVSQGTVYQHNEKTREIYQRILNIITSQQLFDYLAKKIQTPSNGTIEGSFRQVRSVAKHLPLILEQLHILQGELVTYHRLLEEEQKKRERLQGRLTDVEKDKNGSDEKRRDCELQINRNQKEIDRLKEELNQKEFQLEDFRIEAQKATLLPEKEKKIQGLDNQLQLNREEIERLKARIQELEAENAALKTKVEEQKQQINKLDKKILELETEIAKHKKAILEAEQCRDTLNEEKSNIDTLYETIKEQNEKIKEELEAQKKLHERELAEKDLTIEKLKDSLRTKRSILNKREELLKETSKKQWSLQKQLAKLKNEKQVTNKQIRSLEKQLQSLQGNESEAVQDLRGQLNEAMNKRGELLLSIAQLQQQNKENLEIITHLTAEKEELERSLQRIQGELQASQEEVKQLKKDIEGLNEKQALLEETHQRQMREAAARHQQELQTEKEKYEGAVRQKDITQEKLNQKRIALEQAEARLRSLQEELEAIKKKIDEKEAEKNQAIQFLKGDHTSLKRDNEELDELKKQIEGEKQDLNEQLQVLQNALEEARIEIESLKKDKSSLEERLTSALNEVEAKTGLIVSLQEESKKQQIQHQEDLRKTHEKYQAILAEKTAKLAHVKDSLVVLKQQKESLSEEFKKTQKANETVKEALQQIQQGLAKREQEKATLEGVVQDLTRKVENLEEKISQLEKEIQKKDEIIFESSMQNDSLRNQIKEANETIEELQEELESVKRKKQQVETQVKEFLAIIEENERRIKELETSLKEKEEKCNQLIGLTDRYVQESGDRARELAEHRELLAQKNELEIELKKRNEELEQLRQKLAAEEDKNRQLQTKIGSLEAQIQQHEETISQLRITIQTLEKEKNQLEGRYSQLNTRFEDLQQTSSSKIDELEEKIKSLEKEIQSLREQIVTLSQNAGNQTKVKTLEEKLESLQREKLALEKNLLKLHEDDHQSFSKILVSIEKIKDLALELSNRRAEEESNEEDVPNNQQGLQRSLSRMDVQMSHDEAFFSVEKTNEQRIKDLQEQNRDIQLQIDRSLAYISKTMVGAARTIKELKEATLELGKDSSLQPGPQLKEEAEDSEVEKDPMNKKEVSNKAGNKKFDINTRLKKANELLKRRVRLVSKIREEERAGLKSKIRDQESELETLKKTLNEIKEKLKLASETSEENGQKLTKKREETDQLRRQVRDFPSIKEKYETEIAQLKERIAELEDKTVQNLFKEQPLPKELEDLRSAVAVQIERESKDLQKIHSQLKNNDKTALWISNLKRGIEGRGQDVELTFTSIRDIGSDFLDYMESSVQQVEELVEDEDKKNEATGKERPKTIQRRNTLRPNDMRLPTNIREDWIERGKTFAALYKEIKKDLDNSVFKRETYLRQELHKKQEIYTSLGRSIDALARFAEVTSMVIVSTTAKKRGKR